ncbi:MAG: hypothetical protein RL497_819 [Pseudomonadota bacterium]
MIHISKYKIFKRDVAYLRKFTYRQPVTGCIRSKLSQQKKPFHPIFIECNGTEHNKDIIRWNALYSQKPETVCYEISLKFLIADIYLIALTACKAAPQDETPKYLITIETPQYLIAGEQAEITVTLTGEENAQVSGDLYLRINGAERILTTINLTSASPKSTGSYFIDLNGAHPNPAKATIEFREREHNGPLQNIKTTARQSNKAVEIYWNTIDAGFTQTIPSGVEFTINLKADNALENNIGGVADFTWEQLEGPPVQLTHTSNHDVTFTSPNVSEITQLRFLAKKQNNKIGVSTSVEKIIYIVPPQLWVKAIKTFDQGSLLVREDNSVIRTIGAGGFHYKITRPLNEIKNMLSPDYSRLLILYTDKTLDLVVFDNDGNPTLPYSDTPKSPILPYTYYTEKYFYSANNIENINAVDHNGLWEAEVQWQPGINVDKYYTLGAEKGEYTTIFNGSYSPKLSDTGLLQGIFSYYDDRKVPFSIKNVAQFSDGYYYNHANVIGYLSSDGTPAFMRVQSAEKSTAQATPHLILHTETMSKSPFQRSGFVDIQIADEAFFLLEENGHVSSYQNGVWGEYPYLHNIAHLDVLLAVTKDGAAVFWHRSNGSFTQGDIPSPYNINFP